MENPLLKIEEISDCLNKINDSFAEIKKLCPDAKLFFYDENKNETTFDSQINCNVILK